MPIEIRELVIKVKVEESARNTTIMPDPETIRRAIEAACKREVKFQLNKLKER